MSGSGRTKGQATGLGLLIGGLVLTLGALIGFTVAFARPLPAAAWAGLVVVIVVAVVLGVAAYLMIVVADRPTVEPAERAVAPAGDRRLHLLVVANETIGSDTLRREVCDRAGAAPGGCDVLVVAPALNTPLGHWTDQEDEARAGAQQRLEAELAVLAELGVAARGYVAADDPLQAVDDALRTFPADEIVIATHPRGKSNWLEEGVVSRVRDAYRLPVTHVVADG
jgi:hypothetical protein